MTQPDNPGQRNDSLRATLIDGAVRRWTADLVDLSGRNNLLFYHMLRRGTLGFADAAPQETAKLLSGVACRLGRCFPGTALDDAAARARVISRLRWGDVDLDTGALSVRRVLQRYGGAFHLDKPKTTRSRRTIKLPGPVSAALREHRTRQLEERLLAGSAWVGDAWGDLIFASEFGGPLHGTTVGKQFRLIMAKAGFPDLQYHHLRHGAASLMAAQGVPARLAMEASGHSQISTTMQIYTHVAPESLDLVAAKMEEAIWGAS